MKQEQVKRRAHRVREDPEELEQREMDDVKTRIYDEMDALLDEIDGVLEENAEMFVDSFVQHGGE